MFIIEWIQQNYQQLLLPIVGAFVSASIHVIMRQFANSRINNFIIDVSEELKKIHKKLDDIRKHIRSSEKGETAEEEDETDKFELILPSPPHARFLVITLSNTLRSFLYAFVLALAAFVLLLKTLSFWKETDAQQTELCREAPDSEFCREE